MVRCQLWGVVDAVGQTSYARVTASARQSHGTIVGVQIMRCAGRHSCDRFVDFPYENSIIAMYTHELAANIAEKFVMWLA